MKAFPFRILTIKLEEKKILGTFILFAILISVLQDFLNSYFKAYPFFLSESLLFKVFWLIFFPLLLFQQWLVRNYQGKFGRKPLSLPFLTLVLLPTLLHLVVFPMAVLALSALFFNHTFRFSSTLEYTVREDFYIYLAVYGLAAYNFTKNKNRSISVGAYSPPVQADAYPTALQIKDGRKNFSVPLEDVLYINSANPYISIRTAESSHLQLTSLKAIAETLPPQQFVRVHKSTIVNIQKICSYKSRLNGDYDLHMTGGEILRLSRNYAQEFKRRFGENSP